MLHTAPFIGYRPFGLLALLILGSVVLSGCAGTMAFRNAQQLAASEQLEAADAQYQEALQADPSNVRYRAAFLVTRQRLIAKAMDAAARAITAGDRNQAQIQYRLVLQADPNHLGARDGLAAIQREAENEVALQAAQTDLQAGNREGARAKVLAVLAQSPKDQRARNLLRKLENATPEPPSPDLVLAEAYRKTISIDFRDATLRQVFDVIARTSGLNILFDKDVKSDQKTTIFLKNSNIEAAIQYLMLTNQLEQQVMDENTVLIYPSSPAKIKDYQPLFVKTFVLSNANAKAVAESLKTLIKLRDVVVDEKLNMLIIRDSLDAVKLAEKVIALQDVAEPEVMLEVEILEITRGRLQELGVAWPGSLSLTPLASTADVPLTVADLRGLNQTAIGATLDPFKINARAVDSDVNILANPRIRVLNREKARILIGNKVPSITSTVTSTGVVSESITYFDVGLKLEVEPIIYVNNDVAIKIALEVSNIIDTQKSGTGTLTYTIGNRLANTMLRLKDGENQILAGLINDEERKTANKVPGIGDVPVAGRLFGSSLDNAQKTEVVLSITPRLLRNMVRPEGAAAEFLSGTEGSLRRRAGASPSAAALPALPNLSEALGKAERPLEPQKTAP